MRNFILFLVILSTSPIVFGQKDSAMVEQQMDRDLLSFEKHSFDLGDVKKGEIKYFDIKFKNISNVPVSIDFVSSCDCTEVDYPQNEIMPGETGVLKVKFDSSSKEESETTDIDVFLVNKDPDTGTQVYYTLDYSFNLIK